ncbi:MAG: LamG-like jellyroll fold domain-containing protein [Christiangramia sp.]
MHKITFGKVRFGFALFLALQFNLFATNTFAQLSVSGTVSEASCSDASDAAIDITPSGGTAPYSYSWTGPGSYTSSNEDLTGLSTGSYTVQITDSNSNTTSRTFNVGFDDTQDPQARGQNFELLLDSNGNATLSTSDVDNGSTDNCGIDSFSLSQTAFDCSDVGNNSVRFTVTDVNGNSDFVDVTITVKDQTAPTVLTSDYTLTLDANGQGSIAASDIDNGSSDSCGIASRTLSKTDFDCADIGTRTVTLTVTDNNGNAASKNATVTVNDNTAPQVITQTITVQLDASGNATIANDAVNNGSTDACGIASYSTDITSFSCANVGNNSVTLTVTDVNGNAASASATVVVEDNIAPTVQTQNITIYLDANGQASITASDIDNSSSDNCGIASYSLSQENFDCSDVGANTISLTVSDENGNADTVNATVTVVDDEIPVINAVSDITENNDPGACSRVLTISNPGATDNCSVDNPTGTRSDGLSLTQAFPLGTTTITWETTDANGNDAAPVIQTITINDTENPVAPTLDDISWGCEYTLATPEATDNCDVTIEGVPDRSTTFTETGTITWTFTDAAGNTTTASQTITIIPLEAEVTVSDALCNGFSNGMAEVIPSGGIPPYAYDWGSYGNEPDVEGLAAGTYPVTVSDVNGCSITVNAVIDEPAELNIGTSTVTDATCNSGNDGQIIAGTVTGGTPDSSGNYQYSIDNTNFNDTGVFENLSAGNYTIFVKDENECSLQTSVTVGEPAVLSATLSKTDVKCFGESTGVISLTKPTGGHGKYEYSIDGTNWQSTASFNNLASGNYSVQMRDKDYPSCVITLNDTYTISRPAAPLSATVTSTRTTTYDTASGSATANASGGTPGYTYAWMRAGTAAVIQSTKTATNLAAGDYDVTVTDKNGCTFTETVTVSETIFAEIIPTSICEESDSVIRTSYFEVENLTAVGGVGPYTYEWDFDNGGDVSTATGAGPHRVQYNAVGEKTITLVVTDAVGESKTFTFIQYVGECFRDNCGSNDLAYESYYIGDANGNRITFLNYATTSERYLYIVLPDGPERYSFYVEINYSITNPRTGETTYYRPDPSCFYPKEPIPRTARTFEIAEWDFGEFITVESIYFTFSNNIKWGCGQGPKPKCFSTNGGEVVNSPLYAEAVPNELLCYDSDLGRIDITASGGTAPYDYSITSSTDGYQIDETFKNLTAGTYSAWVRDSNGEIFEIENIEISGPSSPITLETTGTDPVCFGEYGTASVSATGGTPFTDGSGNSYYEYLWNDISEQTTSTATDLEAGEYTVTVIDANGCQQIGTVTITEPEQLTIAETGDDQVLGCGFSSTTLDGNTPEIGTGTWTIESGIGGSLTDPTDPNTTFTGEDDTYTLRWTIANTDGTCATYSEMQVTFSADCSTLDFDGVDDHILLADNYQLTSGAFSLEVWVKPESVTGIRTVLSRRDYTNFNSGGYDLIINNGAPTFRWGSTSVSTSSKVTTNRWYHLAVIFNGSNVKLYVDGIEVGNKSMSNPASVTAQTMIGAMYDSATPSNPKNYFDGWIEELRIWNTTLTVEQLHYMMNQRLSNNGGLTKGEVLPADVPGNLSWSKLQGYYRLIADDISNGETPDRSATPSVGLLKNIQTSQYNTAPLPYVSEAANGEWKSRGTWDSNVGGGADLDNYWTWPSDKGINGETITWNIARTKHDIISTGENIYMLGMISETGEVKLNGTVDMNTGKGSGNGFFVTHYLKLDGTMNFDGESQLVQSEGSVLDPASSGYIEIDQQGTANSFNYNYWTSPVSLSGSAINSGFKIASVLHDGSNPATIKDFNFNYQYHWADYYDFSSNKRISTYWLHTFGDAAEDFNGTADDYFEWHHISENDLLPPGIGYSMKGTSGSVPLSKRQNYTFEGLPNNGDVSLYVSSGQNKLIGNPYPSAIDGQKFINDNLGKFNGSIYLWDHFGKEDSHYLEEYVGGYATFNLSGGVSSATSSDARINDNGDRGSKVPGRYIPVGQAFFISTSTGSGSSSGGTLKFTNSMRAFVPESSGDSQFLKPIYPTKEKSLELDYAKDSRYKIRLGFDSPKGYHRQILVTADAHTSNDFDLGYDAPLIENNVEDMYWMINDSEYVIQGVPDFNLDRVLPIGMRIGQEGELTIKIDELENLPKDFDIYLYDKETASYHDLMESDYKISMEPGDINDRFEVVFFKPEDEIEDPEVIEGIDNLVVDYARDLREIRLVNPDRMTIDHVELFSLNGQRIESFDEMGDLQTIDLPINSPLSTAVYIVRVFSDGKQYSRKIIIKE